MAGEDGDNISSRSERRAALVVTLVDHYKYDLEGEPNTRVSKLFLLVLTSGTFAHHAVSREGTKRHT